MNIVSNNYDENAVLSNYVRQWYSEFFTELESRLPDEQWFSNQVPTASEVEIDDFITEHLDGNGEPDHPALTRALREFIQQSLERVVREHSTEMTLLRCERCERIVASPKAKQCLWCGYDWHA